MGDKGKVIYRSKEELLAELQEWQQKKAHAEARKCELNALWGRLPEEKIEKLAQFLQRLEGDIEWYENEIALRECELEGME